MPWYLSRRICLIKEIYKCVEQLKDTQSIYKEDINEETNNNNLRTDIIEEDNKFKKEEEEQNINEDENHYEIIKSQILEDENNNEIEDSSLIEEIDKNEKEMIKDKDIKEIEENILKEKEENEKESKKENYINENEEYIMKEQKISDIIDKSDNFEDNKNENEINNIEEENYFKTIEIKEIEITNIFSNKENKEYKADNNCLYLYYFDINKKEIICLSSDEKICPDDYPYKIKNINECRKYPLKYNDHWVISCPKNTCIDTNISTLDSCIDLNDNIDEIGGYCIYNNTNIISKISNIFESENNKIEIGEKVSMFIYSTKDDINKLSLKYNNLTFINLGNCVNDLIKYYNYPDDTIFYIIGIDSPNKLSKSITNYYQYIVVDEKGDKIDTKNICSQSEIITSCPIIKKELIQYNIANELYYQGYDIYKLNSNFYIDDCTPANIDGNDIGFYNRKEDFFPENIEFCFENCYFEYTDYNLSRFICNCLSGEKMINNSQNYFVIENNFFKYLDEKVNYRIFKCFDLFINYQNYSKINFGLYFGIIILFIFIANISYFSSKGVRMLRLISLSNIKNINNKNDLRKSVNVFQLDKKNYISKKKKVRKTKFFKASPLKMNSKYVNYKKKNELTSKNNQKIKKEKLNSFSNSKKNLKKETTYSIRDSKIKNLEFSEERKLELSDNNMINLSNNYDYKIKKNKTNEKIEYNELSYSKALLLDKRNLFLIFFNSFVLKINLIQILFYPEEFTSKSITISIFLLSCLLELFINSLLFTDEVISKKYNNNGKLDFITSLILSIASNIISSFISFLFKKFTKYHLIFIQIEKEIKEERSYLIALKNAFLFIKRNISIFVIIGIFINIISLYYISIFCIMYYHSQISLLYNYFIGSIESLIISVISTIISSILRIVGLNLKIRKIFDISRYIDDNF